MFLWKNACPSDQNTLHAISLLFRKHPDLLPYLFNPNRPKLRLPAEVLLKRARAFSSGEELLVRLGLDIWDGSGQAPFREIYQILDLANFQNTLETLCFLRNFPLSPSADSENSPPPGS